MRKRAGEAEGQETAAEAADSAPDAKKTKRGTEDDAPAGAGLLCDDVTRNILARLPARVVVASMALSKHHRRLIRSPEFRALHRRLGAPLPRPHVAYVTTAPIKRRPRQKGLVRGYLGFHVAGAGGLSGISAPMRALAGRAYLDVGYVNTCNGVVLLAGEEFSDDSCTCFLWNPAVDDFVKEVTVPNPPAWTEYLVLGFGYGRRSETYKMLLCRKDTCSKDRRSVGHDDMYRYEYSLVIYTLGAGNKQPELRTVLSVGEDEAISEKKALHLDGSMYLLHEDESAILALDVDDEIVTTVDLPGKDDPDREARYDSELMEMSGRPCMSTNEGYKKVLWLLSGDHRWEQRCAITEYDILHCSISGIWDCGGVLVMYVQGKDDDDSKLFLYNMATEKMSKASLSCDMAPEGSHYGLCWGYKPTLVSPGSIVGELSQDKELLQHNHSADIVEPLKLINDRDKRIGHDATLDTVCFWEFLARIMRKMQFMSSEGPIFFSKKERSRF
ncbi:hypothetical protein ACP70R_011050 [Stipagrostis hirtigluma subsp. patula]